jgi:hypothetical protein
MEENKKPDNPDAFPTPNDRWSDGMTLRDYFAAKAMQGFISDREMYMAIMMDRKTSDLSPDEYIANQSYNLADAMLKQREL